MKNFLKVIIIIFSLSVTFLMIPKANAQIKTAFGNFPDAPTDYYNHVVFQYLIMQDKSDTSNVQMFALGRYSAGNRSCSYSSIATSDPNFMWLNGVKTSGSSTCYGNYYILQNNQWVWQSYIATETNAIPINGINRLGNKPYTDYNIATTINFTYNGNVLVPADSGFDLFKVDFEQGEVIIKDSGGSIANLVTYYIEPNFNNFVPDNFIFSYIENTTGGGFRDSHQLNLTYVENGITYNGNTYHYYYNLPLSYNTGLTFSITDLDNTLIQENQFTAYLSSLTDLSGYTMYDFRNYEFANMSNINTGSFGLSYQLNTNITINAINYNTNTKIDFLTSSYLINSHTDNNGVTWYDFNFNNDPIYLEFINNFNDTSDFYTYIDTYNLYLYFDNNAYIHLSGSPNSIESQDNVVNQSSYKDSQGNIIYNNNPIVIDIDNSNEFFQNLQRYFKDFDNDTFGLTGIITSPLNLIQNLLSDTCNPLIVPIPYINSNLTLPCMSTIYSQYFGGFYIIYQDITFGFVAYWVIVRILNMVKDFRNPDHDEIEVLDL